MNLPSNQLQTVHRLFLFMLGGGSYRPSYSQQQPAMGGGGGLDPFTGRERRIRNSSFGDQMLFKPWSQTPFFRSLPLCEDIYVCKLERDNMTLECFNVIDLYFLTWKIWRFLQFKRVCKFWWLISAGLHFIIFVVFIVNVLGTNSYRSGQTTTPNHTPAGGQNPYFPKVRQILILC